MDAAILEKLRGMKRSAVVALLLWHEGPLGESDVARLLRMDRGTARLDLKELVSLGVATRRPGRYGGYELTGMVVFPPTKVEKPPSGPVIELTGKVEKPPTKVEKPPTKVEKPPSGRAYTYTTTTKSIKQKGVVVVCDPKPENLEAFTANKFDLTPDVLTLAGQEWVTPEYIAGHVAKLRPEDSLGLALKRMKNQEPVSRKKLTPEDDRARFFNGKFAEFIER